MKKEKKISKQLISKINSLVRELGIEWVQKQKKVVLKNKQEVEKVVRDIFEVGVQTWIKILRICGCKVITKNHCIKIQLPQKQTDFSPLESFKINNVNLHHKPRQQEAAVSLEMSLQRSDLDLNSIKSENEARQQFLTNFKNNVKACNSLCDKSILSTLIAYKNKNLNKDHTLNVLTEMRDRIFENQRQLQKCVEHIKSKIEELEEEQNLQKSIKKQEQK